jgi:Ca2+-binding RTX toxin-like protein
VLRGAPGDDVLIGGTGPDTFVFGPNFGKNVVTDFAKEDTLAFEGGVLHNFQEVVAASKQVGADTVITLDAHDTITLVNVSLAHLHQNDFAFLA